MEPG
jgi:hypothetical protein